MLTVNRILILLAVDILGVHSFGCNVAELITHTTKRHHTLKRSVYVTLHRMVYLGLLTYHTNAQRRPFYRVTAKGNEELDTLLAELDNLVRQVKRARRKRKAKR